MVIARGPLEPAQHRNRLVGPDRVGQTQLRQGRPVSDHRSLQVDAPESGLMAAQVGQSGADLFAAARGLAWRPAIASP